MSRFDSCNTTTKNKLFHQYCASMYGSQLWDLSKSDKIFSKWRKYHRIVLGLVNTTHCDLIPLVADNLPIDCMLDLKFLSFFKTIMSSENRAVNYVANSMLKSHTSTMCKNVKHLRYKYDMSLDDIMNLSKFKLKEHCNTKWQSKIDPLYPMYASIIKEMILMTESRNDFIVNNVIVERWLSNEQCKHIIDLLCTI